MSAARFEQDEKATYPFATCARRPHDEGYDKVYLGTQRRPRYPDELQAVAVVDAIFGGRIGLWAIASDKARVRIEQLGNAPERAG